MTKVKAFATLWLRADTHIAGLQAYQCRQVRMLCEKFFEKGRAYERSKNVLPSADNQPYTEEENDRRQS